MTDFRMHLNNGSKALNKGRTVVALRYFDQAAALISPDIHPEIEQHRGICLRMLGRLDEAAAAFKAAIRATTPEQRILRGNIWRDWSMVPFMRGELLKAGTMIEKSLRLLEATEERLSPDEEEERHRGYWNSFGFRARIDTAHYERALLTFNQVRLAQKGRAPDELNTIVWEMKAQRLFPRWKLLPRALKLAFQARHPKRMLQVILLAFAKAIAKRIEGNPQLNFGITSASK